MPRCRRVAVTLVVLALTGTTAVSCGSGSTDAADGSAEDVSSTTSSTRDTKPSGTGKPRSFTAEVWADNWFALYVNGALVGEDSVPITTERSFNAETIRFTATPPLTIAIEAKDFKETDSGIEYIGLPNQQMGDGGLIAQVTDDETREVVAVTTGGWRALVIHHAPLNTTCEKDPDPNATCQFDSVPAPTNWTTASFDAGKWDAATEWSAEAVGPKDGFDEITWDPSARLIWGGDLKVDNTVLFRFTAAG